MGSVTNSAQIDLTASLGKRNEKNGVLHEDKAKKREHIQLPGIHQRTYTLGVQAAQADPLTDADSWWKEAGKH